MPSSFSRSLSAKFIASKAKFCAMNLRLRFSHSPRTASMRLRKPTCFMYVSSLMLGPAMMLMMLRDFLSAFSSRKKGLGTLMNSLKRPRLAGLMFGVLLMCVWESGAPFGALPYLVKAWTTRTTIPIRIERSMMPAMTSRAVVLMWMFMCCLVCLVMPLRAKVNC